MSIFHPTVMYRRITDITAEELKKHGIRGLLLDVDNTLTTHGSQELSRDVKNWLDRMAADGIRLTIVSNALPRRVFPFAEKVGLQAIPCSCKPLPIGFFRGAKRLGLKRRQCMVIGDQVFTDILGARLAGFPCALLEPILPETGKPVMQLKRRIEAGIRRRAACRLQNAATGADKGRKR